MSVFESLSVAKPTADHAAVRIQRILAQTFQQAEASLNQVCQIVDRHGAKEIHQALGKDQDEVSQLYTALKDVLEKFKPGTVVPDLPS